MTVLHIVGAPTPESIPLELVGALAHITPAEAFPLEGPLKPRSIRALWKRLRAGDVCLVHVHYPIAGLVAILIAKSLRVPTVKTEHRDPGSLSPLRRVANRLIARLADGVIFNSVATERSWDRENRRQGRTPPLRAVIYNGVDVAAIDAATTSSQAESGVPTLLTAARLVPEKGHDVIIEALAQIGSDRFRWVVVGDGPRRSELEAKVAEHHLQKNTDFAGRLERAAVYQRLAASDLVVMTSHTEGFCNAVAEAMVAGVPVIATDIPALREVTSGAALLVPVGDVAALRDAILLAAERLDQLKATARELSSAARARFDLSQTAAAHLAFYADVMR